MRLLETQLKYIIVIGIPDFWEALFLFNLLIPFIIFSLSTSWKANFEFFDFSFLAMILGWFLYFKFVFNTGSLTFSKLWLKFSYSGIFKLFTIFEKNSFSTSLRWILSLFIDLSDRKGLTFFQKFFSVMSFSFNFHSNLFQFFSKEKQIYFFVEHIRDDFLPFYVLNIFFLILILPLFP